MALHSHLHRRHVANVHQHEERAATIVSVVYVTAAPTFDGPIGGYTTLIGPPLSQPSDPAPSDPAPSSPPQAPASSQPAPAQSTSSSDESQARTLPAKQQSSQSSQDVRPTPVVQLHISSSSSASSQSSSPSADNASKSSRTPTSSLSPPLIPQTSSLSSSPTSPSSSSTSGLAAASVTSASPTPPAAFQPAGPSSSSGGLSGGARAGIALGLMFGFGAIFALIYFCLRRKKNPSEEYTIADSEKMHFSQSGDTTLRASSVRTAKTASTAPRLSLRPVTQFEPNLSSANRLKTPEPILNPQDRSPDRGFANDPKNPFGAHAESSNQLGGLTIPTLGAANRNTAWPAPYSNPMDVERKSVNVGAETLLTNPGVGATVVAAAAAAQHQETPSAQASAAKAAPHGDDSAPATFKAPVLQEPADLDPSILASMPVPPGSPRSVSSIQSGGSMAPPIHRVQLDFKPSMADELELYAGQLVRILHEYDDGWCRCVRLDRPEQGVAPRNCLSARPVKPRPMGPAPGPGGYPRGGPPPGPYLPNQAPGWTAPPGSMGSQMGSRSASPRPLTPSNGRHSPAPYTNLQPRPLSPANGRSSPGSYAAPARPMSPGPRSYSPQPPALADHQRSQSNSSVQVNNGPPHRLPTVLRSGSPRPNPSTSPPPRKPVPGQAL